jgi:hypothetical protein
VQKNFREKRPNESFGKAPLPPELKNKQCSKIKKIVCDAIEIPIHRRGKFAFTGIAEFHSASFTASRVQLGDPKKTRQNLTGLII